MYLKNIETKTINSQNLKPKTINFLPMQFIYWMQYLEKVKAHSFQFS